MKIGFVGCGNMATAIIKGILKNDIFGEDEIMASVATEESLKTKTDELGIVMTRDNKQVAESSDIIVLAVKPQCYEDVILSIKAYIRPEQIVISIAPGKTTEWMEDKFGRPVKLVRTMPNTPALVGEGMTGVCRNSYVTDEEYAEVFKIMESFGKAEDVSETLMDVVVSVSGSSPAYIYMIIEAMADGAVADGMPREKAYKFAAQAVYGSAKMVLETGMHPGELKDQVCSPGGTTIEAVSVLEEKGVRSAIIEAMRACVKKGRSM